MLSLIINFNYLTHFVLSLWLLYVAISFASLSYIIAAVCANEVPAMMERLYILGLAMITLYWIAFVPPRKSYQIGIRFTHMNDDFDAISMTERNGVTPISKVESQVLDTLGVYTLPNRPCRVGLLLTALVCHLFMYYLAILLR